MQPLLIIINTVSSDNYTFGVCSMYMLQEIPQCMSVHVLTFTYVACSHYYELTLSLFEQKWTIKRSSL